MIYIRIINGSERWVNLLLLFSFCCHLKKNCRPKITTMLYLCVLLYVVEKQKEIGNKCNTISGILNNTEKIPLWRKQYHTFSIVHIFILFVRYFIYDGGNCRHPHRMI